MHIREQTRSLYFTEGWNKHTACTSQKGIPSADSCIWKSLMFMPYLWFLCSFILCVANRQDISDLLVILSSILPIFPLKKIILKTTNKQTKSKPGTLLSTSEWASMVGLNLCKAAESLSLSHPLHCWFHGQYADHFTQLKMK